MFSKGAYVLTFMLIFSLSFEIINSKPCPIGEIVSKPSECTSNNKPGHHCCYLSALEPKVSICLQLSKTVYNGLKKFSFGGMLYDIECENKEEEISGFPKLVVPGSPCGITNPSDPEDCKFYSNDKSSCCFYKDNRMTGCYNLGAPNKGIMSFLGMKLDC